MSKNVILAKDFDISKIDTPRAVQRSFKDSKGKTVKYIEAPVVYNHTLQSGHNVKDSLYIIFPEITAGNKAFSINEEGVKDFGSFRVSLVGEVGEIYEKFLNEIYNFGVDWVVNNADDLGSFGENIKNRDSAIPSFSKTIYYPKKNATPGPPSVYLKLPFLRGQLDADIILPNSKPVPIEYLFGKTFEFIPTVLVRRIYVGAKASIHFHVDKMIIKNIVSKASSPLEDEMLRRAAEEAKERIDGIEAQMLEWTKGGEGFSSSAQTHFETEPEPPVQAPMPTETRTKGAFSDSDSDENVQMPAQEESTRRFRRRS